MDKNKFEENRSDKAF